jgi:hypothetical protein
VEGFQHRPDVVGEEPNTLLRFHLAS